MRNLDPIMERFAEAVQCHRLDSPGRYARFLWQNQGKDRQMGLNAYGCADAANILYTIGRFERDPEVRRSCVEVLQRLQNPETGLFHEPSHHPYHTTAHCIAALELFDARPLYELRALNQYKAREGLYAFLKSLDWRQRGPAAHLCAGMYSALVIAGEVTEEWRTWYFDYLREQTDPEFGFSAKGAIQCGEAPMAVHLYAWFHVLFTFASANQPFPYPGKLIDSCLSLYRDRLFEPEFGRMAGYHEIDWVFPLNRATRQTPHCFAESKAALRDFAGKYFDYLSSVDIEADENFNDLHMLFGAACCATELFLALPGEFTCATPPKNVLDRRPFI